jgi:hypothetical protein
MNTQKFAQAIARHLPKDRRFHPITFQVCWVVRGKRLRLRPPGPDGKLQRGIMIISLIRCGRQVQQLGS